MSICPAIKQKLKQIQLKLHHYLRVSYNQLKGLHQVSHQRISLIFFFYNIATHYLTFQNLYFFFYQFLIPHFIHHSLINQDTQNQIRGTTILTSILYKYMSNQIHKKSILTLKNQFDGLISTINQGQWKQSINLGSLHYNLRVYKLEKLSPKKIKLIYASIVQKFYLTEKIKQEWLQNQLRIYVWLLVCYSHNIQKIADEFVFLNLKQNQAQWKYLSSFFLGKNPQLCYFQYLSIKKITIRNQKWTEQEDQLLSQILKVQQIPHKWIKTAKQFFFRSNKKFFKTAHQCRQRWNNYLDSKKLRGDWSLQDDFLLMSFIIEKGKRWTLIAKQLQNKRTQHSVKNRFKTLLNRQKRIKSEKKKKYDENYLSNKVYSRLQTLIQNKDSRQITVSNKIKIPQRQDQSQCSENQQNQIQYEVYKTQIKQNDEKNSEALVQQDYSLMVSNQYDQKQQKLIAQKKQTILSTLQQKYPETIFEKQENYQFIAYEFADQRKQSSYYLDYDNYFRNLR